MCGIIAYSGQQPAVPVLMSGLHRLEYRGYDSAGLAFVQGQGITCIKSPGKLEELEKKIEASANPLLATCGIAHTRWATHGVPSKANAHPHISMDGKFAMVHNGIIENYKEIKNELTAKGYTFKSETDSEVLLNLVAEYRKTEPDNLSAFSKAVRRANGAYALALLCLDEPEVVYGTRKNAPLVAGCGVGENFIGSDITAFLEHTRKVIFLEEGEIVRITASEVKVLSVKDHSEIHKKINTIEWDIQSAQKGGFKHFMLKEIFEQPTVLRNVLSGRVNADGTRVTLPELDDLPKPDRLRIVACGTSYNAGLWALPYLEAWAGVPVCVEIASEFRYRNPLLVPGEMVLLISQSGETADTLGALQVAREHGCLTLGLCNVVGSSIAREANRVVYTQAGPEVSVASTKALCSQMALLTLLAIYWGSKDGTLSEEKRHALLRDFAALPDLLEKALPSMKKNVRAYAVRAADAHNIFFLGRGQSCALAMEGALKFKELSYVHAEAYAAGEMKHGPIALIDQEFLTIALAPHDEHYGKISSNIAEIAARSGPIIAITHKSLGDNHINAELTWEIPPCAPEFTGFMILPMLQLLSYEAANYLGKDVDQPRNLAKSVTVE